MQRHGHLGSNSKKYQTRSTSSASGQSQEGGEGNTEDATVERAAWWDRTTQRLVDLSTVCFIFLLLPQLVKNSKALAAGNAAALSGLSWMGFTTALMGNTQLLGYFINKGERSAATIQAIGVASNYAVLFQIAAAGLLQPRIVTALALSAAVSIPVNAARWIGSLSSTSRIWRAWQATTGIIGLVAVPQVLWSTFVGTNTLLPAGIAAVLGTALLILDTLGRLPSQLQGLWNAVSAWTATLLFCCQPVAQLAANLMNPASVQGLSLATVLLAMVGNAMMAPRALHTRDVIWTTGTLWGSLAMGWGNLLCMALATGAGSADLLSWPQMAALSVGLLTYFGWVLVMERMVRSKQKLA